MNEIKSIEDFLKSYEETENEIDNLFLFISRMKSNSYILANESLITKSLQNIENCEEQLIRLYNKIGDYLNKNNSSCPGPLFSGSEFTVDCYAGDPLGLGKSDIRHGDKIILNNGSTKVYREVIPVT